MELESPDRDRYVTILKENKDKILIGYRMVIKCVADRYNEEPILDWDPRWGFYPQFTKWGYGVYMVPNRDDYPPRPGTDDEMCAIIADAKAFSRLDVLEMPNSWYGEDIRGEPDALDLYIDQMGYSVSNTIRVAKIEGVLSTGEHKRTHEMAIPPQLLEKELGIQVWCYGDVKMLPKISVNLDLWDVVPANEDLELPGFDPSQYSDEDSDGHEHEHEHEHTTTAE